MRAGPASSRQQARGDHDCRQHRLSPRTTAFGSRKAKIPRAATTSSPSPMPATAPMRSGTLVRPMQEGYTSNAVTRLRNRMCR